LNLNGFKADLAKEKETGKKDQFVKPVVGFKLNLKLKAAAKNNCNCISIEKPFL
jgi:hypothetical protein